MSESPKDKNPAKGKRRDETFEKNRFDDRDLQQVHSQLLREKDEPSENFSPVPLFFVALFMVLAFWAGIYLVRYSGDFGPFYYNETKPLGSSESSGPREVDMMALGQRVYSQNCVACHQATGMGLPNVYPPLVASNWVKDDPALLVNVVLAGLSGPVTVNGNQYNNAMTPFNRLSDEQIAAVLTFIRTSPEYDNAVSAVSPEQVAAVRAEYGSRTDPWSQSELEAIYGPVDGQWEPPAEEEAPAPTAPEEESPAPDTEQAPGGDSPAPEPESESSTTEAPEGQ